MAKLTKKEIAALQAVKDYLSNLENDEDFQSAIAKIQENRDRAQEKDYSKTTEKDQAWMEMGTPADTLLESHIPEAIENLDEILGLAEQ